MIEWMTSTTEVDIMKIPKNSSNSKQCGRCSRCGNVTESVKS